MSLTDAQVKDLTLGLFLQKSDRDKQRKVGASNISDPCTRHLAHALVSNDDTPQKYFLGGKVGTAIHGFLEAAIANSSDDIFTGALVEQKIELGTIEGYGTVHSKPDLVLPGSAQLLDWKTTSRAKIKKIRDYLDGIKQDAASEYTVTKYFGQAQLYAWGLNRAGITIDRVTLVFINRDGTCETDIYTYGVDYDEDFAVALWNRVDNLWKELENGSHPENYEPHPQCYKCSIGI